MRQSPNEDLETNAEITAKVAKISTKSLNPALKSFGLGLIHNLGLKNYSENCGEVLQAYFELKKDLLVFLTEFQESKQGRNLAEKEAKICQKAIDNLKRPVDTATNGKN